MLMIESKEDEFQMVLLGTALGEKDSGRIRYAAAMYFFRRNMLSDEALEVYRMCSKLDHEDPKPSLIKLGRLEDIQVQIE